MAVLCPAGCFHTRGDTLRSCSRAQAACDPPDVFGEQRTSAPGAATLWRGASQQKCVPSSALSAQQPRLLSPAPPPAEAFLHPHEPSRCAPARARGPRCERALGKRAATKAQNASAEAPLAVAQGTLLLPPRAPVSAALLARVSVCRRARLWRGVASVLLLVQHLPMAPRPALPSLTPP